jgi:hypothetical protein
MATPSIRPSPNFNAQHTAELLRKAMKGFGCDNGKVIQALVNCSNAQRQEVIKANFKIESLSGNYEKILE